MNNQEPSLENWPFATKFKESICAGAVNTNFIACPTAVGGIYA